MASASPILSLRELSVVIETREQKKTVLDRLSLDVPRGQTVALVGESGSGKTLAALSILSLLPQAASITHGEVIFEGTDLLKIGQSDLQDLRGNKIGMVFQEPSTSLNPLMQVGKQIGESLKVHKGLGGTITREQVLSLMEIVGIPDPRRRYRAYPHQLSGGVRQRVMIAMALACRPDLLVADEPTTSLDLTIQAQILDLLARLIKDLRMSVLLISHDLGVVATLADRVAVIYSGRVVEEGDVRSILKTPRHPYTQALLNANPAMRRAMGGEHLVALTSGVPTTSDVEGNCPIASVCKRATGRCTSEDPPLIEVGEDHRVRCFEPGAP